MPGPPRDSAASRLLDPSRFLEGVTARYQRIVGLIMGSEEVILVSDPATAQQVLIDKASIYRKVHHHCQDPFSQLGNSACMLIPTSKGRPSVRVQQLSKLLLCPDGLKHQILCIAWLID